ncbi:MAG: preprotein translocase subunit YajC [Oscillospiraceae bacterium]
MFSKDKKINASTLKRISAVAFCVVILITALSGCVTTGDGSATTDDGSPTNMSSYTLIIYLVVIVAVFYFFMIRPEKKKRKKAEEMRNSLSIGDNVTTIGGMVGKIVNISDDFITFETGEDRVRIKIAKWGISSTGKDAEEPEEGTKASDN